MLLVYVAGALTDSIFVDQRAAAQAGHRRAAVLAGDRRRHHPAAAARGRVQQPRRRLAADEPAQGAGQTAGLHRGPRRRRRPVHRQDRHPDRGPDRLHAGGPDGAAHDPSDVLRWGAAVHRDEPSDGGRRVGGNPLDQALWRVARRRAQRTALAGYDPAGVLPFDHERQMVSVLVRDAGRRSRLLVTKGAPGDGARPLRRTCPPRPGRAATPSSPPATGSSPSPPDRPPARTPPTAADEHDLQPGRLPGLPRPAQAGRRRVAAPAGRARASPSRSSPATTPPSPRRSATTSGSPTAPRLTGADLDALDDDAARRRDRARPRSSPGSAPSTRRASSGVQRRSGGGVGVPRRRRQRRARPARRRRRHLGRLGHRRRQGRRRRHPAGEGPRRARRRRRRGPPDLRQHHQVRADGHVEQLRQHVLAPPARRCSCRSCRCCPRRSCSTTCSTTPASWRSPPTTSTRSSCARPSHWDIALHPPVHALLRPAQLGVRLR